MKPKKKRPAGKRRARPARLPRVVIVGFGRAGGALALGLKAAGWPVSTLPRSADSVRRAARLGITLAAHEELMEADVCVLAVPDSAVALAAEAIQEDVGAQTALVHLSGALSLAVLPREAGRGGRAVGSFHPLVAISGPDIALAGHSVAVAASDAKLKETLTRLAQALGLKVLQVSEKRRAAYHAGAVLSAGLAAALLDAAVAALQTAGIDRKAGLEALLPLMRSALDSVDAKGLEKGLTGPVVRGDVDVVQAHLEALPSEVGAVYRLLSRRALALTPRLPVETRRALERMLA